MDTFDIPSSIIVQCTIHDINPDCIFGNFFDSVNMIIELAFYSLHDKRQLFLTWTDIVFNSENTSILMMRNDYDGSNSYFFNRSWAGYKDEFGNLTSLYWIGLDRLHEVSQYGCRIRFDFQRQNGNWQFAEYSHFSVAGSSDNYRLSVGGYSGDFSDGMAYHNGQQFSTYDVDNDPYPGNCASDAGGGYWYNYCASSKSPDLRTIIFGGRIICFSAKPVCGVDISHGREKLGFHKESSHPSRCLPVTLLIGIDSFY